MKQSALVLPPYQTSFHCILRTRPTRRLPTHANSFERTEGLVWAKVLQGLLADENDPRPQTGYAGILNIVLLAVSDHVTSPVGGNTNSIPSPSCTPFTSVFSFSATVSCSTTCFFA